MNITLNKITSSTSIFLDTLRFSAALTVLFSHAQDLWFPSKKHLPSLPFDGAHSAVIIFFVLSGFVIAHTTTFNNRGFFDYAKARLTRLGSILYPALIITAGIEAIVRIQSPTLGIDFSRGASWPRYLISAGFLNEIWFFCSAPPINRPLWSLSFEFWYYVIFGLYFYKGHGWKSYVLPLAACLVAGPKILLMMPVWLFGYFAYRTKKIESKRNPYFLTLCFTITIAALIYLPPFPFGIGTVPLFYASQFVTDWVIGFFFALGLWFLPREEIVSFNPKVVYWIRIFADLTFPIYILHYPLFVLWQSIFVNKVNNATQMWIAIVTVTTVSAIIGFVLNRYRKFWGRPFNWTLRVGKKLMIKGQVEGLG